MFLNMSEKVDLQKSGISTAKLLQMYKCMNKLRLENMFCDVTIEAKGEKIPVQGGVLCTFSPYFKERLKNVKNGDKVIIVEKIEPGIIRAIIDFIYTGEIVLDLDTMDEIAEAAHMFGIAEICTMCANKLRKDMDCFNAMAIRRVANRYNWKDLLNETEEYLEANYLKVLISDIFVVYSKDELLWMMDHKRLGHPLEEMQIWNSVVKWIEHHQEQREPYLFEIMQKMRLENLSISFLNENIRRQPMVNRSHDCMSHLIEHLCERFSPKSDGNSSAS